MLDFAIYVRYMPSRRLRRLDKPLVIHKNAPVQSWVRETLIAFGRIEKWQPYMHAHYKMCVDHTYHSLAVGP